MKITAMYADAARRLLVAWRMNPRPPRHGWREQALCRIENPDLFFPIHCTSDGVQWMEPRRVCLDCPVASDCVAFAMTTGQEHGMWGGTTVWQRKRAGMTTGRQQTA